MHKESDDAFWDIMDWEPEKARTQKQGNDGNTKRETKEDMQLKPPQAGHKGTPRLRGLTPQQAGAAPAVMPPPNNGVEEQVIREGAMAQRRAVEEYDTWNRGAP